MVQAAKISQSDTEKSQSFTENNSVYLCVFSVNLCVNKHKYQK